MSINKQNFQRAINEAAEKERRKGSWQLFDEYEFRQTDGGEAYVQALQGNMSAYEEYQPLIIYPGLFLKFARLADQGEISQEVWKHWVEDYGVLGLEQHDMTRYLIRRYRELGLGLDELLEELALLDRWGREHRLYSGNAAGGPRESYASFVREAHTANRLLRIYEAATSKDDLGNDIPDIATVRRYAKEEGGIGGPINTPREAKGWALGFVGHAVQEVISEDCCPLLRQEGLEISQGWGFHTLLGAMYLQMAWLMTAKEEVRCKLCGRVIAFEQPTISSEDLGQKGYRKPYKTRSDKEFCDRVCKDGWYYQNVTKPRRESESRR